MNSDHPHAPVHAVLVFLCAALFRHHFVQPAAIHIQV